LIKSDEENEEHSEPACISRSTSKDSAGVRTDLFERVATSAWQLPPETVPFSANRDRTLRVFASSDDCQLAMERPHLNETGAVVGLPNA
jgi:hypothetical protein